MTIVLIKDDEGKRVIEVDGQTSEWSRRCGVGRHTSKPNGTSSRRCRPSSTQRGGDENASAVSEEDIERIDDETVVLRTRG